MELERGVEQLTEDIVLALLPGLVAESHGLTLAPPGEVIEVAVGEVVFTADAVDDLNALGRFLRRSCCLDRKLTNRSASSVRAAIQSALSVKLVSRTHA